MHRFIDRLLCPALAAAGLAAATPALAADTIQVDYIVPRIGISLDYIGIGYTDASGSFVSLAGSDIVSSRVEVDFAPANRFVDVDSLTMVMLVTVNGLADPFFTVHGSDLTEVAPGRYHYALTTDAFNGTIYAGRFSIESYGLDRDGNPITLSGTVEPTTGYHYTVAMPSAVPEPTSAALLLGGLLLAPAVGRLRRRSAADVA